LDAPRCFRKGTAGRCFVPSPGCSVVQFPWKKPPPPPRQFRHFAQFSRRFFRKFARSIPPARTFLPAERPLFPEVRRNFPPPWERPCNPRPRWYDRDRKAPKQEVIPMRFRNRSGELFFLLLACLAQVVTVLACTLWREVIFLPERWRVPALTREYLVWYLDEYVPPIDYESQLFSLYFPFAPLLGLLLVVGLV